jgi:hypothetical protein
MSNPVIPVIPVILVIPVTPVIPTKPKTQLILVNECCGKDFVLVKQYITETKEEVKVTKYGIFQAKDLKLIEKYALPIKDYNELKKHSFLIVSIHSATGDTYKIVKST